MHLLRRWSKQKISIVKNQLCNATHLDFRVKDENYYNMAPLKFFNIEKYVKFGAYN